MTWSLLLPPSWFFSKKVCTYTLEFLQSHNWTFCSVQLHCNNSAKTQQTILLAFISAESILASWLWMGKLQYLHPLPLGFLLSVGDYKVLCMHSKYPWGKGFWIWLQRNFCCCWAEAILFVFTVIFALAYGPMYVWLIGLTQPFSGGTFSRHYCTTWSF